MGARARARRDVEALDVIERKSVRACGAGERAGARREGAQPAVLGVGRGVENPARARCGPSAFVRRSFGV